MDFPAFHRGPAFTTLVVLLWAVLIVGARAFAREGFLHHSLLGILAIPCLASAIGLANLKPWGRISTLGTLGIMVLWLSIDIARLQSIISVLPWYRHFPTFGNDVVACEVVGLVLAGLFFWLGNSGRVFSPPANFVSNDDATL